jgi:hypothetical protein
VFDTVGGPNLRLRDNLIQLAAVIAAIPVTGVIALFFTRDLILVAVIAVMGGMLGGILVSGIALGIYRGLKGAERMSRK